jgi:hypothetical protein
LSDVWRIQHLELLLLLRTIRGSDKRNNAPSCYTLFSQSFRSMSAAVARSPVSLPATISHYLIGEMMPDSANPVQQSVTIIEIRSYRGG